MTGVGLTEGQENARRAPIIKAQFHQSANGPFHNSPLNYSNTSQMENTESLQMIQMNTEGKFVESSSIRSCLIKYVFLRMAPSAVD